MPSLMEQFAQRRNEIWKEYEQVVAKELIKLGNLDTLNNLKLRNEAIARRIYKDYKAEIYPATEFVLKKNTLDMYTQPDKYTRARDYFIDNEDSLRLQGNKAWPEVQNMDFDIYTK